MKITYRSEIDGLRAIAVISVIIYHYKITLYDALLFKGGFFGVDIFFVISGYLITSIILHELKTTNNFSFINFYERRIRRIIPALFFVIVISLPFAWFLLLPIDLVDYAQSILSILSFNSNLYFWYTQTQYNADSAMLKPLLHTWSLSVEEQYYIFTPLVFLLIYKFIKKKFLAILIAIFFMSLLSAHYLAYNFPNINFYNPISRVFELLSGSLLAYQEIFNSKKVQIKNKKFFLFLGLFFIFVSITVFDETVVHPSFFTLIPVLGTLMIIYFSSKELLVTKILSNKYLVNIGLISYSLYLWHFPIFSFLKITKFSTSIFYELLIWLLFIVISVCTFLFIEKPFRNRNFISFSNLSYILITIFSLLFSFSILIILQKGFQNRVPELLHQDIFYTRERSSSIENCLNRFEEKSGCELNSKSTKTIFLIGDSHMSDLYNFGLKKVLIDKDYNINTFACFVYPGFSLMDIRTNEVYEKCSSENFSLIEKKLLKAKAPTVIFFGRIPVHLSDERYNNGEGGIEKNGEPLEIKYISKLKNYSLEKSFSILINKLLEKDAKIIFIYPYPEAGWDVPKKLMSILPKKISDIESFLVEKNFITTSYNAYIERSKKSFELLNSFENKNIYRIFPDKFLCNNLIKNRCLTHDDKNIYYRDSHHPSPAGAKIINDLIINEINNIEFLK